jgi:hypothetical protein
MGYGRNRSFPVINALRRVAADMARLRRYPRFALHARTAAIVFSTCACGLLSV